MVSGSTLAIGIPATLGMAAADRASSMARPEPSRTGAGCAYAVPVAPRLAPGEQVMFQGHPSWRSIIAFYVKGLFIVLIAAFVVGIVTSIIGDDTDAGLVAVVAVVGVAVVVLAGLIKRITVHYTITTRRLHIKRGIVSREIQETRLERVQNVNYDQSAAATPAPGRRRGLRHRCRRRLQLHLRRRGQSRRSGRAGRPGHPAAHPEGLGDEPTAPTRLG